VTAPIWLPIGPGGRRLAAAPGPWFQYGDAIGFEWNTYELPVRGLPAALAGFRIVHLTDLHCRPGWQTAYDDLFDRLALHEPDLLVVTGDVVDDIHHPSRCLPTARRLLAGLHARLGVFGQLGNHDRFLRPNALARTPLRLIDGRRVVLDANGERIELIATPGPMHDDMPDAFRRSLPPRAAGVPRIILSHYPDHLRKLRCARPDLFLAGHTHGGQVCLPGRLPILRHDSYPWRLRAGVNRVGRTWLVVGRGLGFSTAPVRLFCPAEVIEIRLVPSEPAEPSGSAQ
jgi:predicted MPP superfamily phosphohydrolase